ncbi:D-alanyl-D-alanine carboxypeptidase family protein [Priestia taiwanensis]|uniref:serine-type D-Ala-D-Ala carboxypeptidase n=1 Tax=Priestia taiwanensis TaxID=1347902 RepID=A0A917EKN9_9BACI|nr:D-alanyl-D-alanine carboxypeptidase family protein [Priestia taiwanensis]MBM7361477.1 D-alanyl-D-alanine carboxypeptidase (penicillin-binding protein 5/6) [Priestia taiwanensis]GGE54494.1 D-alanyl-D-alanine carboxypeptidase [Priestia taiwanensis]
MKRLIGAFVVLLLVMPPTYSTVSANKSKEESTSTDLVPGASSAVVIEQDTGNILYEKNSNQALPPASMTKIMTMLLIMDQIESGKLTLEEKVRASEYAASMGGSQIFLEVGEEMTVDELLRGIAIASGNDASMAMAERIAGSEEAFVKMMNEKAQELGLKNTKFQNPTGLPAKDHYSSAYDMAIMGRELLKYPLITKYTGTYEGYLRENTDRKFWLVNTNKLVKFYPGVDGLKTGFTGEAKYCLTATAKKGNMRVISVVMGAQTSKERNAQVSKLLDFAFNTYETKQLYEKGQLVQKIKVSKGEKEELPLVAEYNVSLLLRKGEKGEHLTQEVKKKDSVRAPVKKGDELGTLVVKNKNKVVSEIPLIASEDVQEASWWQIFKRTMGSFTRFN